MLDSLVSIAPIVAVLAAVINGILAAAVFFLRRAAPEKSPANGHEWPMSYELAISLTEKYIRRADDGTLFLDLRLGDRLGIDPVLFADLSRSLDETNKKIRSGQISSEELVGGAF